MSPVPYLEFAKSGLCYATSISVLVCFRVQNFTEIRQADSELWPKKTIFNVVAVRRLEYKKI